MATAVARERVREARVSIYRETLLDAAEPVFAEHGYEAASMAQIAQRAGMSLATVYGVFASKLELFGAIHAHHGKALLVRAANLVFARPGRVLGPRDLLLEGVRAYVQYLVEHPHYLRMHLRERDFWAVDPSLRTTEQERTFTQGMGMAAQVFARGIAEGVFIDDDPSVMARTMIAMHQVRLADWVARGMQDDPERLVSAIQAQLVRCFCCPDRTATELAR
jgi:AcrR family transcriptional regulator